MCHSIWSASWPHRSGFDCCAAIVTSQDRVDRHSTLSSQKTLKQISCSPAAAEPCADGRGGHSRSAPRSGDPGGSGGADATAAAAAPNMLAARDGAAAPSQSMSAIFAVSSTRTASAGLLYVCALGCGMSLAVSMTLSRSASFTKSAARCEHSTTQHSRGQCSRGQRMLNELQH